MSVFDELGLPDPSLPSGAPASVFASLGLPDPVAKPSGIARRALGDTGVSLAKGIIGVPEAAVGLANLPTGGMAGKAAQAIGFAPKEWKESLDEYYSPEQKAANAAVHNAEGFGGTLKAAIQNPSVIAGTVAESLPLMIGGGVVARALPAGLSAVARGAIGEGIVGAGSASEQMRQASEDGLQSPRQAIASLASGAGTAAFGALGGKLSQKMGIADVDTLLAGGSTRVARDAAGNVINKGLPRRVIEGGLAEGALEELPQSMWEQAAQNVGTGQPLAAGVPEAGAMGMLAGTAMGSVAGGIYKPTNPQAGPIAKAAATGELSGANEQMRQEQAAATIEATNETNPSDARAKGSPLAQDAGTGEAPAPNATVAGAGGAGTGMAAAVQRGPGESVLAGGDGSPANSGVVADAASPVAPPQNSPATFPIEQQAIAAPQNQTTAQALPVSAQQPPTIEGISNGTQAQEAKQAAPRRPAQPATAANSAGVAFTTPAQPTTNAGPLPQQSVAMPVKDALSGERISASTRAPAVKDSFTTAPTTEQVSPVKTPLVPQLGGVTDDGVPTVKDSLSVAPAQPPEAPENGENGNRGKNGNPAIDLSTRTDQQLAYLSTNGHPGHKEAAIEEIARRAGRLAPTPVASFTAGPQGATNERAQAGAQGVEETKDKTGQATGTGGPRKAPAQVPEGDTASGQQGSAAADLDRDADPSGADRVIAETEPQRGLPVVAHETAADETQAPLSRADAPQAADDARKTDLEKRKADLLEKSKRMDEKPAGVSSPESRQSPIQKRDDLIGAIMRVTGGNGIHSSMALDTTGDDASKSPKLRGLFTPRGTQDLGDTAGLLRTEEGYDVRDGEHLADLIRQAAGGDVPVSMERQERDRDADKERRHRDRIRAQAKKYGVKVVGVKFSVVEGRVLFIEQRRQRKAVELLSDRDKARFDAAVAQSEGLVSDEEIQAILQDLADRGITGRDAWQEALVLQRQLAEDARFKQEQGALEDAEDRATSEEPDWFKDFDDEADSKLGNEGTTAASNDFTLEQQSIADADRQEAERVAAEKAARESAEKAAREERAKANKAEKDRRAADVLKERETAKKAEVDAAADAFELGQDAPAPVVKKVTIKDAIGQKEIFGDGSGEGGKPAGVAEQERSVYAVNEPDGVTGDILQGATRDIFEGTENALPEASGKNLHGQRSAARRGVRAAPGPSSRVLAVRQSPDEPGIYHVSTQLVTVGERALPVDRINPVGSRGVAAAAKAFAYLSRHAVEHADAIVTDKDGRMLAIIGSFKGALTQTSVYPSTVVAELSRIDGAAHLWLAHNHPSGLAELSAADRNLSEEFARVLDGTGVEYHGLFAMAGKAGSRGVVAYHHTLHDRGEVAGDLPTPHRVPIVERELTDERTPGEGIHGAKMAIPAVSKIAGKTPGIVFLDSQNIPSAFVPFAGDELGRLKVGGRLMRLFRSVSQANAGSAIIAMPDGKVTKQQLSNVISALSGIDVRVLDAIEYASDGSEEGTSLAMYVELPRPGHLFFSNASTDTLSTPADRAVYGMVADGKSSAEVLSFISKASRRPFNRVLASHLSRIGVTPNITLDSQGGWQFGNTSRAQRYAAAYNPKTDTVALFTPRDAERHALHEMVHAATLKAIAAGGPASVQMRALFIRLKRTKALAGQYGMSSIDEFVAEAFSNPKFQQALKAIPAPAGSGLKSAWQWFVRAVARVLGLRTPAMETALDRAMTVGAQLMRENAALLERNGEKLDAIREADAVRYSADGMPDTITVDGVERQTTNSNGKPIAQDEAGVRRFYEWFGKSAVTDAQGRPLVVYHGTDGDFNSFDPTKQNKRNARMGMGFYFTTDEDSASMSGDRVISAYLRIENQMLVSEDGSPSFGSNGQKILSALRADPVGKTAELRGQGYDGIQNGNTYIAFSPEQIKSATGNSGQFSPDNPDIRYNIATDWYNGPSGAPVRNAWQASKAKAANILAPKTLDKIIYEMQDKFIDLKRLQAHIKAIGGTITDMNDAYLGEELYHKRLAYRTEKFASDELLPLLAEAKANGISKDGLESFLHARHAPEANAAMAKRNPNQAEIDAGRLRAAATVRALEIRRQQAMANGSATKAIDAALNNARGEMANWNGAQAFRGTEEERVSLSGMSDADAATLMTGLSPEKRAALNALATRVDAINEGTLSLLGSYGLMSNESLNEWRKAYRHYIPLHRDEAHPDSLSHPIGQGFSTKGDAAKRRTGSNQKVTNILGHIAMQREAALTRGEKNRVMTKLYMLARQNPMPDVWKVGTVPMIDTIDKATGFVKSIPDPLYKQKPNVLVLRVGGKDVAITINEHNPDALRMVHALKNLDVDDLHYLIPVVGKATRWFAAMNTQYNPIFGLVNLMRDTQEAALNLSSTELAGKQGEIFKDQLSILREVLKNKGRMPKTGPWAALFDEFNRVGGTTGYRDLFLDAEGRGKALQSTLDSLDRGKASQAFHAVADWLSDYNEAMENATRLAAYKAGIDSGMTKERAASLAKNLTVNFNRKGRQTRELGALYAFFNAAVQGTARMAQTLSGPTGRKIMAGGVALGAINAMIGIAMMGGGDDGDDEYEKIPDFVKQRAIIIPTSAHTYISLPMPLGFQFLPNIGRLAVEWAHYKEKTAGKQLVEMFSVLAEAFNPMGGNSPAMQMVAPTVMDPFVALAQNKDWTGKPIYIENRNSLDPKPGADRSKDSATPWAKWFSKTINDFTGGTEYTPGGWSPTPDQIDFVIGQLTGGIGREAGKVASTVASPFNGEELPAYKVPLLGRLYGSTEGHSGQSDTFYENITRANEAEGEIKGRMKAGLSPAEYLQDHPGAMALAARGNAAEKQVAALRKMRHAVVKRDAPDAAERAHVLNNRIAAIMTRFNREVSLADSRQELAQP